MHPHIYNQHYKNQQVKSLIAFKESLYKIHDRNGVWQTSLYAYDVPLKDIIVSYREISLMKNEHKTKCHNEVFVSIEQANHKNRYFYVILTPAFKQWFRGESLEFIQQSNASLNDVYLLKIGSTSVFDYWLDYKLKGEIELFFNIEL